jgi:EmrB/QacA subfamily drug resistance transporter
VALENEGSNPSTHPKKNQINPLPERSGFISQTFHQTQMAFDCLMLRKMSNFRNVIMTNTAKSATSQNPSVSKTSLLFTACIFLFVGSYMFACLNIALPKISAEFQPDAVLLSWLSTVIVIGSAVLFLPFGRLADITGIRRMIILGMILYTLAAVLAFFSNSINMLLVARVLQGVSGAMTIGNTMALVSIVFPAEERGKALGISSASVYVGLTLSPVIAGFLTERFGWRSIFTVSIGAGLLVIVLILTKIRGEWRGAQGEKMDIAGSAFFIASFLLIMYGLSSISSGLPHWQSALYIGAGLIILGIFVIWELKTPFPIINIRLFKNNRIFILSNISAMINYASLFPASFLLSLYLQLVRGFNAETASLILVAQPVMQVIISPLAGRLSDRIEPRLISSIGMGVACLGLAIFGFITVDTPIWVIIGTLMLLGTAYGLFVAPNTNAIMGSVEHKYYGIASAALNTSRNLGQMFGMALMAILLSFLMGKVILTPEHSSAFPAYTSACRTIFYIFSGVCFVGIFTSLVRGKVR